MLNILRRIVQEVHDARNLTEALQILVHRVREATHTQACSIFLIDAQQDEFVLMATDGLNPEAVGRLRFPSDKGLVGLIIQREEPLNVEDAPAHPNFYYSPAIREEPFRAFLGVPIIHQRKVLGVLIIQQEEKRRFDEAEEAFMVTLSAQIASEIAHAQAVGAIHFYTDVADSALPSQQRFDGATFGGVPGAPGIGIGQCLVVYPLADLDAVPDREPEDMLAEIAQFDMALQAARDDMEVLRARLSATLPSDERALFDVYLQILDKVALGDEVIQEIRLGNWAQGALRTVIERHEKHFEDMDDEYLRERAADIRDLGRRVLAHLQAHQVSKRTYYDHTILIGEEVTPAAMMEVPEGKLVGIVSMRGSSNSHMAILSRALGIATVTAVEDLSLTRLEGREVIVDGYYGQVYVSPTAALKQEFKALLAQEKQLDTDLQALRDLPAETPDGYRIELMVNTGLAADASMALSVGAEGVGLYRTEVPFMSRDRFPTEDEQHSLYQQLLAAFAPRPVIMRTLDVGGDKPLPYFPVEEDNPFLGWRGIRITLDHPEVFLVQLRAMLRASVGFDNLCIMFPMISGCGELDEALNFLNQAYNELLEEGLVLQYPKVGIMVEVPAAVYLAKQLAKKVDFLSVGTNDLTQYLLAVDRNNSRVAGLYDGLHPAVLQALMQVVEGAHGEGIKVSVCGEMASDPLAVILLLAMGFDALSMNATSLPRMKWVIRQFTMEQAEELLAEVLTMDDPNVIRCYLELALEQAGLGGLIRIGK